MKLRRSTAAASVLALTLLTAACGGDDGGTTAAPSGTTFDAGTTMDRLNKAQKITVGTKFDQPLFGLKGLSGNPEGFDVEIAKIIAAELGIAADKISWVETPSAIREEKIEQGGVDLVAATYTINEKRKERITFAGPYYEAGQDLMVKSDNTTITGPETLKGTAKVCSVTGSTPSENIKKYINANQLVLFDVYSKCADALRTGQVDVVTTDNVILLGLIENSSGAFKLVGKPFTKEPYGLGIKKADVKFCEFIHQTLTKASGDGRYAKAWTDTAGKVAKETPSLPTLGTCA